VNARFSVALTAAVLVAFTVASPARADTDDECIAASERAVGSKKSGALLQARQDLASCAAPACPEAVRTSCADRLAELNASIPTIVFDVKNARDEDTASAKIFIDGRLVADSLTGQAIEIDPGAHTLRVELAGETPIERQLIVREGEKARRETISFPPHEAAPSPPSPPPASSSPLPPPSPEPPRAEENAGWSFQKKAGLAVAIVGVAGIGIGAGFGAAATSQWSNAKSECTSIDTCGPGSTAQRDHDAAQTSATISTVSFIVGGAALAGGAVLFFLPSSRAQSSAAHVGIAPTNGGAALLFRGEL
jgi:hypothetical protein